MSSRQDVIGASSPLPIELKDRQHVAWPRSSFAVLSVVAALLLAGLLGCGSVPEPPSPTPSPSSAPAPTPTPSPIAASFALPFPPPRQLVDLRRRINPHGSPPAATPVLPHDDPVGTEHEFPVWAPPAQFGAHVPLRAHL